MCLFWPSPHVCLCSICSLSVATAKQMRSNTDSCHTEAAPAVPSMCPQTGPIVRQRQRVTTTRSQEIAKRKTMCLVLTRDQGRQHRRAQPWPSLPCSLGERKRLVPFFSVYWVQIFCIYISCICFRQEISFRIEPGMASFYPSQFKNRTLRKCVHLCVCW